MPRSVDCSVERVTERGRPALPFYFSRSKQRAGGTPAVPGDAPRPYLVGGRMPVEGKRWAGVLATAGGILIYADPNGDLVAVDQKDGKRLWHIPTNHTIKTAPMTYTAGGRQYIAIAAGSNILSFGLP